MGPCASVMIGVRYNKVILWHMRRANVYKIDRIVKLRRLYCTLVFCGILD